MDERPLEFTEKGIPCSLAPAFQEYDIEKLDPAQDAFTIIERTLKWGDRRECRWLLSVTAASASPTGSARPVSGCSRVVVFPCGARC